MAKAEVSVNVEKTMHDSFQKIAQNLWSKFGLRVTHIRLEWRDVSTCGKYDFLCTSVDCESQTFGTVEEENA